jgi:acetyltransferase-like isoleucine patch superfamily enzyme
MLRKIYFSPFGVIISAAMQLMGRAVRPFMMYGYWDSGTRRLRRRTRVSSSTVLVNRSNINMGDDCWIGHHSIIDGSNGVTIGRGVQIAGLSGIYSHSSHEAIRLCGARYIDIDEKDRPGYIRGSVEIGEFTFIGVSSVVLPGARIGRGCVIGAGAVVVGDIPDYSIAVGSPARVVGTTLESDKKFFKDPRAVADYYDPAIIEDYLGAESHLNRAS